VGIDVGAQTKLADDGVEEAAPLAVVARSEVEDDRQGGTCGAAERAGPDAAGGVRC
jgi:hypothetical protein